MPEKGKKNLNSNVEETILKDFDRHNKIRGYTKYRALEGMICPFHLLFIIYY